MGPARRGFRRVAYGHPVFLAGKPSVSAGFGLFARWRSAF
jgi:hypothetical protein